MRRAVSVFLGIQSSARILVLASSMGNTKQTTKTRRKAKGEEAKEQPQTPKRKRVSRGARPRSRSILKRVRRWFSVFVALIAEKLRGPAVVRKRAGIKRRGFSAHHALGNVPKWVYGFVAVAGLIVTLLVGLYPWLSIYPRDSLDIRNPYSSPFDVTNDRNIPITSVTAKCIFDFGKGHHVAMGYDNFAAPLGHKHTITAPCFHIIAGKALQTDNATITMQIRYWLLGVFPRSQQFRFHSTRAEDGSTYWIYDDAMIPMS
jgi:hypothetical protein